MGDADRFAEESQQARGLVIAQLRALWGRTRPDARLDCFEPSAPMAVCAVIRSPEGAVLAEVSAHADSANLLLGESAQLCAFDDGTAEQRARHVLAAVAALLALNRNDA